MARNQQFGRAGAWVFIICGIGHAVFFDALPLVFGTYLFEIHDREQVLSIMRAAEMSFPLPGQTDMYMAFWGFSIWGGFSLVVLGVLNILVLRLNPVSTSALRGIYAIDLIAAIGFLVITTLCFFAIPILGGLLMVALFGAALVSSLKAVDSSKGQSPN